MSELAMAPATRELKGAAEQFSQQAAHSQENVAAVLPTLEQLTRCLQDLTRSNDAGTASCDTATTALNSTLYQVLLPLQNAIDDLETSINSQPEALRHPHVPQKGLGCAEDLEMRDYVAECKRALSYAHRISYSTFAPPGHQLGAPLGFFRPPAPQEYQMCFSALHQFAGEVAQQMASAPPQPPQATAQDVEATFRAALAREGVHWPAGMPLPPPPPHWRPGEDIQLPPDVIAQVRAMLGIVEPQGPTPGVPPQGPSQQPEQGPLQGPAEPPAVEVVSSVGIDHGLLLDIGAVLEEVSGDEDEDEDEDESSDGGSSE